MKQLIILIFCFQFSLGLHAHNKVEYGFASTYSDEFHGVPTASGELYNKNKPTAAHKTLAFGSVVKITNLDNNRSVIVRINDRGPFIKGYVIEVSRSASETLKIKEGKAKVKIEIVKEESYPNPSELDENLLVANDVEPLDSKSDEFVPKSYENNDDKKEVKSTDTSTKTKAPNTKKDTELSPLKAEDYVAFDLYKTTTFDPKEGGYGVQIGNYNNFHNVLKETAKLQENWFSNIMLTRQTEGDKTIYKLIIGPFDSREAAASYQKNADKKGVKGFVTAVQAVEGLEVYQIKAVRPAKEGFAVQIMNLTDADNVIKEIENLKKKWFKNILVNVEKGEDGTPEYKILLGPLPDKETAESYKKSLAKNKKINGFLVNLTDIKKME